VILVVIAAAALLAGRRGPATAGVPVLVPIEPASPPPSLRAFDEP